jgi:hypothetical protein
MTPVFTSDLEYKASITEFSEIQDLPKMYKNRS